MRFEFPTNTRFTGLPVRTAYGLLFPLSGETYCCSPEIYLARRLGARLEIVTRIILPTSFELRPFEPFILEAAKRRATYPKGSLENLFWKELGNGTYGKVAQGLRKKRAFNSCTDTHIDLPPSRITNPYFAAYVTSLVRAVLGEILSSLPPHASVCNATTDGFLTNASDADVESATTGPLCRQYAQARLRISGNPTVLERKHRIAQPIGWRTRGQATLKPLPGSDPVLAKAGLKAPRELGEADEQSVNEYFVKQFLERNPQSRQEFKRLRGLLDIYRNGGDLVEVNVSRRVSMEFDWKRKPVSPSMRAINGVDHLFFETAPWATKEEFDKRRDDALAYRTDQSGVLKTVHDLQAFEEFCSIPRSNPKVRAPRKDSARTLFKRQFLRAYVRSAWISTAIRCLIQRLPGGSPASGCRPQKKM